MTYANYKKALAKVSTVRDLERLLALAEGDESLSDNGYYSIKMLIINKLYN